MRKGREKDHLIFLDVSNLSEGGNGNLLNESMLNPAMINFMNKSPGLPGSLLSAY
jgi:hypothetical protein